MATVALKLGDDVSTDVIYPGRFMATLLPSETPQFALADDKEFNAALNAGRIPRGSVILAGRNFGCGSSREQAVSALKGHELIIVAESFARIFFQNAVNLGLLLVAAPGVRGDAGDRLEIGPETVTNATTGASYSVRGMPASRRAIVDAGGLIPYTRSRLLNRHNHSA